MAPFSAPAPPPAARPPNEAFEPPNEACEPLLEPPGLYSLLKHATGGLIDVSYASWSSEFIKKMRVFRSEKPPAAPAAAADFPPAAAAFGRRREAYGLPLRHSTSQTVDTYGLLAPSP